MKRKPAAWIVLFLLLAVALLYGRTAGFEFVNYDDNRYLLENRHVFTGWTQENVVWAFQIHGPSMWIPLTWLSHQAMVSAFGLSPGPHHVLNVLLHAGNAVLLFLLLRTMTGSVGRSAAVAAMFALHPIHVESVAWVTERKDVLALFFCLLALIGYARYVRLGGVRNYALVALAFAAAAMAKPLAVTLPCVMLLLDFWPLRRLEKGTLRRVAIEKVPLLAISVFASTMTVLCQMAAEAIGTLEVFPLATRMSNAAVAYAAYLKKLVWPNDLAVFYPYPEAHGWGLVALSVLILLAITAVAAFRARTRPYLLVGWLWFLGTLVPMIGVVQAGSAAMADRYAYLPFIGLYIMAAWSAGDLLAARRRFAAFAAPAGALLAILLFATAWRQAGVWRDSETLFRQAIAVTEKNYLAHNNLALALQQQGLQDEAQFHFEQSLAARPDYREALNNMGILMAEKGDTGAALEFFVRAIQIHPPDAITAHNIGRAHVSLTNRAMAESWIRYALDLDPEFAAAHYNLAHLLMEDRRLDEAGRFFREAIRYDPSHADAWVNLGVLHERAGFPSEAEAAYRQALRVSPHHGRGHYNLGLLFAERQEWTAAAAHFEAAVRAEPGFIAARSRWADTLRILNDYENARSEYEAILGIDPGHADTYNDLGVLFGAQNRHREARDYFLQALLLEPNHTLAAENLQRAEATAK